MVIAKENEIKSIAFPAISTGVYGYPKRPAAKIAVDTVKKFMEQFPETVEDIYFVVFDEESLKIYESILV